MKYNNRDWELEVKYVYRVRIGGEVYRDWELEVKDIEWELEVIYIEWDWR